MARSAASHETAENGEEVEDNKWANKLDFLLSLIGYSVGLGNIWRFPYLCMRNGGGAFLIPYYFFLIICGIPLFYLESIVAQYSGLDAISVWKICPLFRGVGYGTILTTGILLVYYNTIIAWVLYYLGMSFTSSLPWSDCGNSWNTPQCSTSALLNSSSFLNISESDNNISISRLARITPAEDFWQNNVLGISSGIHEMGSISWRLLLCLMTVWLVCFLCVCKGIKSSGKVVYVTATAPYLFLAALLVRGVTLPGASSGLLYFIKPNFERLAMLKTWAEAAIQIFYTLGPAWGGVIAMASHNHFKNNCFRDSMIICWVCCGTSFFGGLVVFSVLGFLSHELELPIEKVVTSGPGLAFITYPAAVAKIPFAPIWSVCFFLMLFMVGLDSQFVNLEVVISSCLGRKQKLLQKYRTPIAGIVSALCCCIGLIFITNGGMYYFQIIDWYVAAFSVFVFGTLECIVLSWIYGFNRLYHDIEMMLGYRPSVIWRGLWGFITPALLCIMIGYNAVTMTRPSYGSYQYPKEAVIFGFILAFLPIVPVPAVVIYDVLKSKGSLFERICTRLRPDHIWGPSTEQYRSKYNNNKTPELQEMEVLKTQDISLNEVQG